MKTRESAARLWYAAKVAGWLAVASFFIAAYVAGGEELPNPLILGSWLAISAVTAVIWLSVTIYLDWHERKGRLSLRLPEPRPPSEPEPADGVPRWDLLQLESQLLQTRFDKYDALVFQLRGWVMTMALGAVSAYLVIDQRPRGIPILAALAGMGFYLLEYRWRMAWNKYVARYKTLRKLLDERMPLHAISPMDLTDHKRRRARKDRYVEAYGEFLGPKIERAYTADERLLPEGTAREMAIFYLVLIGGLLFLPELITKF